MSKTTPDRRALHFNSLDEIVADAEAVTAGPHRTTGNWSAAQIIDHVTRVIDLSSRGNAPDAPLPVRLFGRTLRLLGRHRKPFPVGIKFPPAFAPRFEPPADVTLEAALDYLRREVAHAKEHGMTHASPLFGNLSHDEWLAVHCRHAELHFGFIHPESD